MAILIALLVAAAPAPAAAKPAMADPAPSVSPLVVTAPKTVEQQITERGWLIRGDAESLKGLSDKQVVCRKLRRINSRIISTRYTCGPVSDWREITRMGQCLLQRSYC